MKLYFVRHAQSEANVLEVVSNRGWIHPLTELGREQAQALAVVLRDVGAVKIYTSPLRRAVETAEILAKALNLPLEISDGLREFDCGVLEGRSDEDCWRQHHALREGWLLHGAYEQRLEGGESYQDILRRFRPFLQRVVADHAGDEAVILLGHGGTYQAMLPAVCANLEPSAGWQRPFPNTSYVMVESSPDGFMCKAWCGEEIQMPR